MAKLAAVWNKAFTSGSKSLQDRLKKVHASNPEFQSWLKSSGHGAGESVKQASKEVKPTARAQSLQQKSLKAYGATKGTRMGSDDGSGEAIRDTIAPLTRDQHAKVQAAEREAKAAAKKAAPAAPKKPLTTSQRLSAIAAAVRKAKAKHDVPTMEPDDEGHDDLRDVYQSLHIRGYNEEKERYHFLYPHVPLNLHNDHEYNKLSDDELQNVKNHQRELADKLGRPGAKEKSDIASHIQINRARSKYDQEQAHNGKKANEELVKELRSSPFYKKWASVIENNDLPKITSVKRAVTPMVLVQGEVDGDNALQEMEKKPFQKGAYSEAVDRMALIKKMAAKNKMNKPAALTKKPQTVRRAVTTHQHFSFFGDLDYAGKDKKQGSNRFEEVEQVDEGKVAKALAVGAMTLAPERAMELEKMKKEEFEQIDEVTKKEAESALGGPVKEIPKMPPGKQPAGYRYVRNLARKAMKAGLKKEEVEQIDEAKKTFQVSQRNSMESGWRANFDNLKDAKKHAKTDWGFKNDKKAHVKEISYTSHDPR